MKVQIIQDSNGNNAGVFIPMNEWELIESTYPDIANLSDELPKWQKELIDERLELYKNHPEQVMPIEQFFEQMDNDDL